MKKGIKWAIDPSHSEITFKIRHLMIAYVKGSFTTFDANIITSGKDFTTAEIDFWIEVASIQTGDINRDEHLKGRDFFDTANHKQITFTSGIVGKADHNGQHEVWGDLTLKGATKKIKLNLRFGGIAIDEQGKEKAGFTVTGKLKRTEWGLNWNQPLENGGIMLSEEVSISCEFELFNTEYHRMNRAIESNIGKNGQQ